jgi:beta-phosphoglucomutase-like phosphatase (HAD superfamily)
MLSGIKIDFVLAGDIVKRKKPDPEIYLIALEKTKLRAGDCICIEDSRNGVEAAKAAGLNVLATTNEYTEREDLSSADIIVDGLGEPASRKVKLTYAKPGTVVEDYLTASWIVRYFEGA